MQPSNRTAQASTEASSASAGSVSSKSVKTPRKKAAATGPGAARPKKRVPTPAERVEQALKLIVLSLDEDKALDIVTLDLRGRTSFADYMVIATGIADRQMAAMAQHIEEKLHEIGMKRIVIEGAHETDWVLLDTGDIIVHLFKPESRALYALERMWGEDLDDLEVTEVKTIDL